MPGRNNAPVSCSSENSKLFQRQTAAKQERSCQFLWNPCWQLQQHGSNKAGYFCQFCWRTLAAHRRKAKICEFCQFWWGLAEGGGKVKAVRRCWPGGPRSYPGSARPGKCCQCYTDPYPQDYFSQKMKNPQNEKSWVSLADFEFLLRFLFFCLFRFLLSLHCLA